ncbi:glycosyltransferase, partial [Clostridium tarantellae]
MKILFIACYSPMINNSASIETLMYLNNLCSINNNELHLITVDFPKESIYYDKEVYKLLDNRVKVHAISGGKLFEKIMPKKVNKVNNEEIIKTRNNKINLVKKIKNKVVFPDMYYYWSFKAYKYAEELMEKENFHVIFSMHEPPSSHLCALKLKKRFKEVPWILYWSDPWLQDPSRQNIGFLRKIIEGNMERKVVINGDKHIFVTEENRKEFISKYGIKNKNTFIITRGYDKNSYSKIKNYKKPNLLKNDKINIVYTGEIFSKLRD